MVKARVEVYDFMYVDAPRIRSLISQLHDIGVLDGVTETDEAEHGKSSTVSGTMGPKALLSSEAGKGSERITRESQSRKYDVQYALPIDLLDMLENDCLVTDAANDFRYGSIARLTGNVYAMDLSILHGSWGTIAKMSDEIDQPGMEDLVDKMLSSMPPSVQVVMGSGSAKVWANLPREHWLVPPANITLSHGTKISGDWTILGVVDALPENRASTNVSTPSSQMAEAMDQIGDALRRLMGRPIDCYGFSPILVYRKVLRNR